MTQSPSGPFERRHGLDETAVDLPVMTVDDPHWPPPAQTRQPTARTRAERPHRSHPPRWPLLAALLLFTAVGAGLAGAWAMLQLHSTPEVTAPAPAPTPAPQPVDLSPTPTEIPAETPAEPPVEPPVEPAVRPPAGGQPIQAAVIPLASTRQGQTGLRVVIEVEGYEPALVELSPSRAPGASIRGQRRFRARKHPTRPPRPGPHDLEPW